MGGTRAMDAQVWDERYRTSELVWSEGPNRFVDEVASGLGAGHALDLGCGEGRNAIWLARRSWNVTGVDFSQVAIDKAKRLANAAGVQVDWRCEDVLSFDPEARSYDFLLLCYLQLSAERMPTVLEHGRRALADGGMLMVIGHARVNLTKGVGGPQDERVLYEPSDITGWLGDLNTLRAEHVIRLVNTEQGPREAIDTLVLATNRGRQIGVGC